MTRFRLPAMARAILAGACAAVLSSGLLSGPVARAGTPASPAPDTASLPAGPPGAAIPAAVLAAKSRIRAPADPGPFTVTLTASRADGGSPFYTVPGHAITLTATTNIDVGPTPYFIEIFNYFGTFLLKACAAGTTCSVDVTENSPFAPGQIAFVAYVAEGADWLPAPDVQADTTGNPFEPSWLYPMTLTGYKFGGGVTLDFTDGGAITWAPWYIQIYDATRDQIVAWCAKPSGCSAIPGWAGYYPDPNNPGCDCGWAWTGDSSYSSDFFYVVIAVYSGVWPPPDIRDWADHAV